MLPVRRFFSSVGQQVVRYNVPNVLVLHNLPRTDEGRKKYIGMIKRFCTHPRIPYPCLEKAVDETDDFITQVDNLVFRHVPLHQNVKYEESIKAVLGLMDTRFFCDDFPKYTKETYVSLESETHFVEIMTRNNFHEAKLVMVGSSTSVYTTHDLLSCTDLKSRFRSFFSRKTV